MRSGWWMACRVRWTGWCEPCSVSGFGREAWRSKRGGGILLTRRTLRSSCPGACPMARVMAVLVAGLLTLVAGACQPSTVRLNECVDVGGSFNPAAPGFVVFYHSGVDPVATTSRLETKYAFSASFVYKSIPGFAAELSTAALSGIRCEPTVSSIEHGAVVYPAGAAPHWSAAPSMVARSVDKRLRFP